ncbi:hypothetical protein IQ215_02445 [Cyanobacterium stanieri LEGE 03274]|uniref:PEP-CTERM sorting domain-containing protein n=1 Tax=Cyanobacterium stanieri LEGE 03274 TaxID=1828756 RepID=A0ABR9V0Z2_9CHRO|nr:hypothetical protein [Cyanobacterium stanieri]MBE9221547.1 hypothetical protein [Cyanobacterium stanieri LEGE 03274]
MKANFICRITYNLTYVFITHLLINMPKLEAAELFNGGACPTGQATTALASGNILNANPFSTNGGNAFQCYRLDSFTGTPLSALVGLRNIGSGNAIETQFVITVEEFLNESSSNFQQPTAGTIADLRGFFFNFGGAGGQFNNLILTNYSASGLTSGNQSFSFEKSLNNITSAGSKANTITPEGPFDLGLEFGTNGIARDDIQRVTFHISSTTGAVRATDFTSAGTGQGNNLLFGLRATSVGVDPNREGSSKAVYSGTPETGSNTNLIEVIAVDEPIEIPEGQNILMFFTLGGFMRMSRRLRKKETL